jgi:hypothetical protein
MYAGKRAFIVASCCGVRCLSAAFNVPAALAGFAPLEAPDAAAPVVVLVAAADRAEAAGAVPEARCVWLPQPARAMAAVASAMNARSDLTDCLPRATRCYSVVAFVAAGASTNRDTS